jgi:cobalt-zinc-cadmium efflux system protein
MALLADAGHMLTDAGALVAAVWAARLARRPATGVMTWGFQRAEILSGALNGITLLVLGAVLLVGAADRLIHPTAVAGADLIAVAAVGIVVNAAATWLVARADRHRLDVAGAYRHLVTDGWAFGGTLAAGIVIVATGFDRADAIASLLVVGLMVRAAWPLLRASGRVLLEAAPEGVDLESVRAHLLSVPDVEAVHDLHAWAVASDLPALTAHVVVADRCFASGAAPALLDRLQACLAGHFDVEHSTFQLEAAGHASHEPGHHA